MRISDWSSDVCSSDLPAHCLVEIALPPVQIVRAGIATIKRDENFVRVRDRQNLLHALGSEHRAVGVPLEWRVRKQPTCYREELVETRVHQGLAAPVRSEERRVGKEWGRTCR